MTNTQVTQFGPYRVLEKIGSGGMGEVYRAQDTRLGREVAVKLVFERYLAEAFGSGSPPGTPGAAATTTPATVSQRRFLREAQSASRLNHPNICTIYDIGEEAGRPYLVMELLRGQTLKEALRRGPFSVTDVVSFSRQATAGLAAAHAQGIVHRDIKPANLFVSEGARGSRQIKILDFGLAKQQGQGDLESSGEATATFSGLLTATGETAGTPQHELTSPGSTLGTVAYMSPEQAKGDPLDARTDLFSLGVVIYEMATGTRPFAGKSTAELFAALLTKDPAPVTSLNALMPVGLDGITARLLTKEKGQRYQTAEEVLQDLEALEVEASHGSSARPSTPSPASPPPPSLGDVPPAKGRSAIWWIVPLIILLLGAGGLAWWKHPVGSARQPGATSNSNPASPAAATKNAIILADFVNQTGDPVFQTTLNQALMVQLGQSPVLDIVSQQHLRQSLQYLGRKPDEVITSAIAREIGEREGIKAILTGTIAALGNDYIITLTAQNTVTGDQIASVQTQAAGKEKVLDALNQAAAELRGKLGESLASVQKLNTPFGQATTPSLEAFRAYALGDAAHFNAEDFPEAEDHYKRALSLDPRLAMAWARLGVISLNGGRNGKAIEYFTRAHELSGNVSEHERLYIEGHYYGEVVGDLDKAVETLEVAIQEYPLQTDNHINLGAFYQSTGEIEKSRLAMLQALALQPDEAVAMVNLVGVYLVSDQFAQSREYVAKMKQLGLNGTDILQYTMALDGASGDRGEITKLLAAGAGRPDQFVLTAQWGNIQAQWGQFHAATGTLQQSARQAAEARAGDAQAALILNAAWAGWPVKQCQNPDGAVRQALATDKSKPTQIAIAATHAFCGAGKTALTELAVLEEKYPDDTLVQRAFVPQARAAVALDAGDGQKALDSLAKSRSFDLVSPAAYLRGLAYLELHDAGNAIAAFKAATEFKGSSYLNVNSNPFPMNCYALGLLGLGRAYAMGGDKTQAKATYERFFEEWKNADAQLPLMAEAKKEYAGL